jgi:hypothetical protein
LRKWLNGTFLNAAFSAKEQSSIVSSTVIADKNPSYITSPGNNTTDKVFLLSITEVNKYFKSGEARKCAPTDYAIAQGVWTSSSYKAGDRATCWWWLRSPGYFSNYAAFINIDGSVDNYGYLICDGSTLDYGYDADRGYGAIRPAMWIDIGAGN